MNDGTKDQTLKIARKAKGKVHYGKLITFRVGEDEQTWLDEVTSQSALSVSEVVRGLIAAAKSREIVPVFMDR